MAVGPSKLPDITPEQTPFAKNMSQFARFWLSEKGRFAMSGVAVAAACGYFGGYVALHVWFLPNYRNAVQLYKNGFMTPPTADVFERAKTALEDVKLPEKQKQSVNFFSVYGMDMFFAGSTKTTGGVAIGIPRNYSYKTQADLERNDIIVDGNNVEWGSDGGQLLQEALVLSENAQKFGIARDICMSDTHYVYSRGIMGSSSIMLYFFLSRNANDMLYGLYKPRSFRTVVYSGLSLFCFGIWAVSSDLLTKFYENYADKRAGSLNLSYAKGGVEFYSRTLQRNMALRSIMGPPGEKRFTFFGNDVEFIRERHVPFTRRKHNMEKIAERLSQASTMNNSSPVDNLQRDSHLLKS
ncbi:transmembrane protein 177 [Folsomia candida]|uniref:Transmembrane protein 177 n=1 Tax=Folsomia candida TaxID=158441 RepID=A0A226ELY2_FOLCA|nr:transmembrane protein 177 [Folsomia candida]XP_021949933.1 transmembrane protein 177 [Folsomia candida]OXA57751.1 hypothetical protein Fcan01_07798 [Folsomia candida]